MTTGAAPHPEPEPEHRTDEPRTDEHRTDAAPRGGVARVVLVAVAVVALAAGAAIGLLVGGSVLRPATPTEGSVDVGFARDMSVHHGQAVEMSVLVRDRSDDAAVRQLALDILVTQGHQQGQMFGWLATWGLPAASTAEPMAWAGDAHAHGGSPGTGAATGGMPGLATTEQMARLEAADGVEADRLFLALMIPHHVGGVEMAEVAVDRATQPQVRRLAEAVVASQQAELTLLEEMLAERGGAPTGL